MDQTDQMINEIQMEHNQWVQSLQTFLENSRTFSNKERDIKVEKVRALAKQIETEQMALKMRKIEELEYSVQQIIEQQREDQKRFEANKKFNEPILLDVGGRLMATSRNTVDKFRHSLLSYQFSGE